MNDAEVPFDRVQTLDEIEATFEIPPETSVPPPAQEDDQKLQLQLYDTNTQRIEVLKAKCLELSCATPEGYEDTRRMIGLLRTTRTRVEKRRKEHNADAQAHIKFVNSVAKKLTDFIVNLEDPLKAMKAEVDDAKERAKRAEEEAATAAEEARLRAEREAEEAKLKAEADRIAQERAEFAAQVARQRAELEAEMARLAAEQAAITKSQQEAQAKIDAERRAIEEAKAAAERTERERLAKIEAERRAAEQAASAARLEALIAAEEAKVREAERQKSDFDKLIAYAVTIRQIAHRTPQVASPEASQALVQASVSLEAAAQRLESFTP